MLTISYVFLTLGSLWRICVCLLYHFYKYSESLKLFLDRKFKIIIFKRLSHYLVVTLKGNASAGERLMYNNFFTYIIFIPQILSNGQIKDITKYNKRNGLKKNKSKRYWMIQRSFRSSSSLERSLCCRRPYLTAVFQVLQLLQSLCPLFRNVSWGASVALQMSFILCTLTSCDSLY